MVANGGALVIFWTIYCLHRNPK